MIAGWEAFIFDLERYSARRMVGDCQLVEPALGAAATT